jgi:hypothetical protein
MLEDVLHEPEWFDKMTEADWRGLTPLFYRHVNPIGIIELDMGKQMQFTNLRRSA